jgi:hypothetical protein
LVALLCALAIVFGGDDTVQTAMILGLAPGFGLGLVIASCSAEDYAGARGLLLIPLLTLLGMAFSALAWMGVSLVDGHRVLVALIYAIAFALASACFFATVRAVYESKISLQYLAPVLAASTLCALPLLAFTLTPLLHGLVTALWLAVFGYGLARKSGRRSARRVRWLKGL